MPYSASLALGWCLGMANHLAPGNVPLVEQALESTMVVFAGRRSAAKEWLGRRGSSPSWSESQVEDIFAELEGNGP